MMSRQALGTGRRTSNDVDATTPKTDLGSNPASSGSEEIVEYRTLSLLAIVSLLMGLISLLSLFAPLLLGISFFGAAVSILALRRITASDGLLAGRGVALVGLALCVASVGVVWGRAFATRQLLTHQANEFALEWFDLLRSGQPERAFEWTTASLRTPSSALPAVSPGRSGGTSEALERFQKDPVVRAIVKVGAGGIVRKVRNLAFELDRSGQGTLQQLYSITPVEPGHVALEVHLTLQRGTASATDRPHWMIKSYALENEPTAASPRNG
jgi:hypothetical protein